MFGEVRSSLTRGVPVGEAEPFVAEDVLVERPGQERSRRQTAVLASIAPVARRMIIAVEAPGYQAAVNPAVMQPKTESFADVAVGTTLFKQVEWVKANRIPNGYPYGTHHWIETVFRRAMAPFLYRSAGVSS
jgi:hypothetical protein